LIALFCFTKVIFFKNFLLFQSLDSYGTKYYYSSIFEGLLYRARDVFVSRDYANSWNLLHEQGHFFFSEAYFEECEFISIVGRGFYYTHDCFQNYINITIDEEYVFGNVGGYFPDVYRGGKAGEVYVSSMFPDGSYKVSFSADTGQTFRHVYICDKECFNPVSGNLIPTITSFMSDREPGVFYIFKISEVNDTDPWGLHVKMCIEYYRDYGETLEATFCHDITKNYEYEEVNCEHTTFLETNTHQNAIQLQWSNSADNIRGYHVYRNNVRITNHELQENTYLDENLPVGEYEYYVRAYYNEGCVSDSSNRVTERVELGVKGVKELEGVRLFPNPTTGKLHISHISNLISQIEIYDVYGRKQEGAKGRKDESANEVVIDISRLSAGIYFVRVMTENGVVTKKVVKM
jgi:hypothetical protein